MLPGDGSPRATPPPGVADDSARRKAGERAEIARTLRLLLALACVTIIGVMLLHGLNLA